MTMEHNPSILSLDQLSLFSLEEHSIGAVELFPAVWGAAEALTSDNLANRSKGIEILEDLQAARFSPLIAYLLATRLTEPDRTLRAQIVRVLGEVFELDDQGRHAPLNVRRHLKAYLSSMRTRQIFALLEVLEEAAELETQVASLLNFCPHAGNQLLDILVNRDFRLQMRLNAANLIGRVGYIYTRPDLERLLARLEARAHGQQSMPFAPEEPGEEQVLTPALQDALRQLRLL